VSLDLRGLMLGMAGIAALYAAWVDLTSFRIPNWISMVIMTLFVAFAVQARMPLDEVLLHFATGTAILIIGMALFAWGKVGGGDAKLLSAVALWFGWPMLLTGLLMIAIFGGVLAVVVLMGRQTGIGPWLAAHGYDFPVLEPTQGLPYGVAIAAGFLFLIFMPVGL
jgi:prepilin peptidase CpaA